MWHTDDRSFTTHDSAHSPCPAIAFHIPNTDACDPVSHRDKELEIIAVACTYAVSVVTAYATSLISIARTHRNHMSPIYRIPEEVLSIIFEFTKSSLRNPSRPLSTKAPVNISQVSRRWRGVALNNPMLWTAIDASNAPLAHLYMERSRSCPLHIELRNYSEDYPSSDASDEDRHELAMGDAAYDTQSEDYQGFFRPLLPHIERWRGLSLEGLFYEDFETLKLPHAPNLDCLRLFTSGDTALSLESLPPHAPFDQRLPKLSILELEDFELPFTSSMFIGLKELYLHYLTYPDGAPQDLLDIIVACPLLEKVKFEHIQLGEQPDPVLRLYSKSILCPNLRSMELYFMEPSTARSILSSIVIPPTARLAIWMYHHDNCLGDILPPAALLAQCLPNLFAMRALCFEIRPIFSQIWITGKTCEGGIELLQLQLQCPYSSFTYMHTPLSGAAEDVASNFGRALPNLPVHTLSFLAVHSYQLSERAFSEFVGSMSAITLVSLNECDAPTFLEMLAVTTTRHLCPSLQALHLRLSYFRTPLLDDIIKSRQPQNLCIRITSSSGTDEYTPSGLESLAE
ncbi:hypothetical protein BOTBODRAFT_31148 [Botryobasidium botryosum FD-172 SS1]|uniref:F-box domain-containing protein n=1 Tax=Botryobasidium botryosum (strain FD-172 SS1) TaxID=930990 RepID=A0A067MJW3_BOTB1|nr:hypothetical protein BOTBODRAFT_31148 [Botryobasidium botryosum FD-172 SS1]